MVVRAGGADDPASRIERVLSAQEAGFIRVFLRAIQNIVDAHTLEVLEELLLQGRVEEALEALDAAASLLGAQYGQSFTAAAEDTARFLSAEALTVAIGFDQTNQRAVDAITRNRLRVIREFTAEQRRATSQALQDGIARGLNPREQARQFRQSIGLTTRQQASVENYRRLLTQGRAGNLPSETALRRALRDGRGDRSILRAIRDNRPLPDAQVDRLVEFYRNRYVRYRSEVIARTEALRSVHQGSEEMYRQAIDLGQINPQQIRRRWNTAGDERVRESHMDLNGEVRMLGEVWQAQGGALRFPGDPEAPPEETVQCFTGDTLVAANGVKKAFKRLYKGTLIEIKIDNANTLSVTPNHPILTSNGWIAASEIVEGCNVVCGTGVKGFVSGDVNIKGMPPRFDEIFDALSDSGNVMRKAGSSVDFHGDVSGGDIDIVLAAGNLSSGPDASVGQHRNQFSFPFADPMRKFSAFTPVGSFAKFFKRSSRPFNSLVGIYYLLLSLLRRHARPLNNLGLAGGSHVGLGIAEHRAHDCTRNIVPLGQRILGFAASVKPSRFIFTDKSPIATDVDLLDAKFSQRPMDGVTRDAKLAGDILNGYFGGIHFSQVISVSERQATTHVYNLHTESNFYIANGVVAHNCRCVISTRILAN